MCSAAFGDVDQDGALDLIAGNFGQTNKLYLNDGSGGFPSSGTQVGSETENTTSLALGDIDRDGDLDLIAGWLNCIISADCCAPNCRKSPDFLLPPWDVN